MTGILSVGGPSRVALSTCIITILLVSTPAVLAAGPRLAAGTSYPVLASRSTTVAVVNGSASVDDSGTTGLAATVTGIVGAANVTFVTESLAAPSLGETGPQVGSGGSVTYFGLALTLPAGASFESGAKANVCVTLPYYPTKLVATIVEYWNGSAWADTASQTYSGEGNDWICGDAPVSALAGANIAAVFPGYPTATSTTSTTVSTSHTTSTTVSTGAASSSTSASTTSSTTGATATAAAPVTLYLGIVIVAAFVTAGAILAARRGRRGRGTSGS